MIFSVIFWKIHPPFFIILPEDLGFVEGFLILNADLHVFDVMLTSVLFCGIGMIGIGAQTRDQVGVIASKASTGIAVVVLTGLHYLNIPKVAAFTRQ